MRKRFYFIGFEWLVYRLRINLGHKWKTTFSIYFSSWTDENTTKKTPSWGFHLAEIDKDFIRLHLLARKVRNFLLERRKLELTAKRIPYEFIRVGYVCLLGFGYCIQLYTHVIEVKWWISIQRYGTHCPFVQVD